MVYRPQTGALWWQWENRSQWLSGDPFRYLSLHKLGTLFTEYYKISFSSETGGGLSSAPLRFECELKRGILLQEKEESTKTNPKGMIRFLHPGVFQEIGSQFTMVHLCLVEGLCLSHLSSFYNPLCLGRLCRPDGWT